MPLDAIAREAEAEKTLAVEARARASGGRVLAAAAMPVSCLDNWGVPHYSTMVLETGMLPTCVLALPRWQNLILSCSSQAQPDCFYSVDSLK
ncbi:MAG: hypothetical protein ACRDOK_16030 [Streptosporangiaceae bacterium]